MGRRQRWSDMDKREIPLAQLQSAFEVYNQTSGKSPHTSRWYNEKLSLFERFLGDGCTLADLTLESVREFIAHLQDRRVRHEFNPFVKNKKGTLSSSYIQGFARALRAFSTWLHAEGYTDINVLKPLKPPRIQRKAVEVLTQDEINRILSHFDQDDSFGARNYAIVWTLLDCGLRASELSGLRIEDAHLEQGYVKVLGKGNKERLVPIGGRTQTILSRWRDCFRSQFLVGESSYLFLGASGHPLTQTSLETMMKRVGRAVGVPRLHAHLLRHTFATTYLVQEVGDPLRLQQILGHTSLEMVRHYVAIASVQQNLLDRRASTIDRFAADLGGPRHARRVQPRRSLALRLVRQR
jgi:site-specific recombinase XerD